MNADHDPSRVAERAWALYDRAIKTALASDHLGEALVIDVESGDYEVHPDEDIAVDRLEQKRPSGTFYVMRVGSPYSQFVGAPTE